MRYSLLWKESVAEKKAPIIYSAQVVIYLMHYPLNILTKQFLVHKCILFIHPAFALRHRPKVQFESNLLGNNNEYKANEVPLSQVSSTECKQ